MRWLFAALTLLIVAIAAQAELITTSPSGGGGGSSTITSGTTSTSGCVDNGVLASRTSKVTCDGAILSPSGGPVSIGNAGNSTPQLTFVPNSGTALSIGSANGGSILDFFLSSTPLVGISASGYLVSSNTGFLWTNAANNPNTTLDTSLWRQGAGVMQIGDSAQNSNGRLSLAAVFSGGTSPTGNTGTCSTAVTVAGGATAGTWTSTAICALGGTIIFTAMPAAPTGYACFMTDRTTNGVTVEQTATSTTSATFTVRTLPTGSVATVANDILQYHCMGY
jgi:hypothetical protein